MVTPETLQITEAAADLASLPEITGETLTKWVSEDPSRASYPAGRARAREIHEMAEVRQPRQFIMAIIDGIGWKNRVSDLRQIYSLRERQQIDGMYTLATLERFHDGLLQAARLRNLVPAL